MHLFEIFLISNTNLGITITEKYISPQALPGEQINCWLKWKGDEKFDHIIITHPNNIDVTHFLNIDEEVLNFNQHDAKEYLIKKDWIQVDGFIGLKSAYNSILESNKPIAFDIKFVNLEKNIHQEKLVTTIIRPRIVYSYVSTHEITITELMTEISLDIQLQIVDNPNVRNIHGVSKIYKSNEGIDVKIVTNKSEIPEISLSSPHISDTLIVNGEGLAIVRLCFEYEDFRGNKYSTDEISVTIEKKIPQTANIPVQTFMKGNVPLVSSRSR